MLSANLVRRKSSSIESEGFGQPEKTGRQLAIFADEVAGQHIQRGGNPESPLIDGELAMTAELGDRQAPNNDVVRTNAVSRSSVVLREVRIVGTGHTVVIREGEFCGAATTPSCLLTSPAARRRTVRTLAEYETEWSVFPRLPRNPAFTLNKRGRILRACDTSIEHFSWAGVETARSQTSNFIPMVRLTDTDQTHPLQKTERANLAGQNSRVRSSRIADGNVNRWMETSNSRIKGPRIKGASEWGSRHRRTLISMLTVFVMRTTFNQLAGATFHWTPSIFE